MRESGPLLAILSVILIGCSGTPVTFATYYPDQKKRPFYSLILNPYIYDPGTDVSATTDQQQSPQNKLPFAKQQFVGDLMEQCAPAQLSTYANRVWLSDNYFMNNVDYAPSGPCKDKSELTDYQCWAYKHPKIAECVAKIALEAEDQCTRLVGYQNHMVASFVFYTNAIGYLSAAAAVGLAASNGGAAVTAAAIISTSLTNTSNFQKSFPTTVSDKLSDAGNNMTQAVLGAGLKDDDFEIIHELSNEKDESGHLTIFHDSPDVQWWLEPSHDKVRAVSLRYALVHDRILGYCPAINP